MVDGVWCLWMVWCVVFESVVFEWCCCGVKMVCCDVEWCVVVWIVCCGVVDGVMWCLNGVL
jgi:hypothetical protein